MPPSPRPPADGSPPERPGSLFRRPEHRTRSLAPWLAALAAVVALALVLPYLARWF
ncbi:MAG: hypothetical protein ABIK96_04455 [bacterium]|nr:hypothetical protein [bacterium]